MNESVSAAPNTPPQRARYKFLLIGIALAALIGAALGGLNHFVKEENAFHEAQQEMAYPSKTTSKTITPPSPTTAALRAPTTSAHPPR